MFRQRKIDRIVTIPPLKTGFGGPQHRATFVIPQGDFARTDPFFLMAEDHFLVDGPVGAAHPHAGIETVLFKLKGTGSADGFEIHEGDVEWLTAGSGVIHSENTFLSAGMCGLQLWVVLPEAAHSVPPRVQLIRRDSAPVRRLPGVELRLYSGRSGEIVSPTRNATPVTLADIRLESGGMLEQEVQLADNGFLLVLEGEIVAGESNVCISSGQIGWLDRPAGAGDSVLTIRCEGAAARVLLYTGTPQYFFPVAQGPFVAASDAGLSQFFEDYHKGLFPRAATLAMESPA